MMGSGSNIQARLQTLLDLRSHDFPIEGIFQRSLLSLLIDRPIDLT